MVAPNYNPKGKCNFAYEGIMCSECKLGFSKTKPFYCGYCPEKVKNIVRIVFILLAAIILMVILIRITL